jgi:carboxylesterase
MTNLLDQHVKPAVPFSHLGGPTGVLLVHGFLGSPDELQPLAERLVKDGHTVRVVLLPGHGHNPERLKGITWQRWADHVQSELKELKRSTNRTVLIGSSMGGLLNLIMAAKGLCDAVVTLAPALELQEQKQMLLIGFIKYIMPWMYLYKDAGFESLETQRNIRRLLPNANFSDPVFLARLRKEVRLPLAAICELGAVQRAVKPILKNVRVPLLVVQGRQDQIVKPICAQIVFDAVSSSCKDIAWFDRSEHIMLDGVECVAICNTVSAWIDKTMG